MDIQLIVGAGTVDAEDPAVAELAARLFDPPQDRTARNLMTYFDRAGGLGNRFVGPYSTTYDTRGMSQYLDFLVAGLSEKVVQAEYRSNSLEQWKMVRKEQLEKKSAMQAARRNNAFFRALYGEGHPHIRAQIDDPKEVRDIRLRDLESFRDQHYRAANSTLIVTGGFDMGLMTQYVEAFFDKPDLRDSRSTWLEPKATDERTAAPPPTPGDIRAFTEVDKLRAQTQLRIAFPLAEVYGEEHAALEVMAAMLNFKVSRVRQKLGASYGIYSRLSFSRPRVEVGGAVDSTRADEGLQAILNALQELRDAEGDAFDQQFAFARRNVVSTLVNVQADPQLLAGQLARGVRAGRGYAYFQDLTKSIAQLKPEQVRAVIDRVLDPKRSVTMVQGPQTGIDAASKLLDPATVQALPNVVHDE